MVQLGLQLGYDLALIGSPERIRDGIAAWKESIATTLLVAGPPQMLELIADAAR